VRPSTLSWLAAVVLGILSTGATAHPPRRFGQLVENNDGEEGTKPLAARHWSLAATGQFQAIFDAPTVAGGIFPSAPLVGAEATMHNFIRSGFAWSFDGQYGWATGTAVSPRIGAPLSYRYSLVTAGTSIFYEWNQAGRWVPFGGARLGLNWMSREFDDLSFPRQTFSTISPGLVGGLKYRFTRNLGVLVRGRLHYLLYNVDETKGLGYAEVGLLFSWEFLE
jgi:hypothetical protein